MSTITENAPFKGVRTEITTAIDYDEVLNRLHAQMSRVTIKDIVALAQTPISQADYARELEERLKSDSGFSLFAEIDHGAWLPKFGINRRTIRLIFGNPLIALTMIRHDITAGLFAPVELLVTEGEDGRGAVLTFVRPSTLMVVVDNPPLLDAATALDEKFDALVNKITTP